MNKQSKKSIFVSMIILSILIISFTSYFVIAGSFNPEDEREIGFEFLDDNQVIHIWNIQDSYFFNKSSGVQFTNHYKNYWTRNIFCIGYYDGDEWVKIKCSDELSNFNRDIITDNSTYVNATLWKDITYGNYDLRLGVQYHLGLNDENLSITVYGKNIGIDIPFDLGFAWKITDFEIPHNSPLGDSIFINQTDYNLDGNFDIIFKNMSHTYYDPELEEFVTEYDSYFRAYDWTKFLRIDWKNSLDYAVKIHGDGNQENFYVALLINAGSFDSGQEKSTTFYWIDAEGDYTGEAWLVHEDNDVLYGITNNNTYIWIPDVEDLEVYTYLMNGTYVSKWALNASNGNPVGITQNGTFFWVTNPSGFDAVFKYDMAGTYISTTDIYNNTNDPAGITQNGTFIWIVNNDDDTVSKYDMDMNYISKWSVDELNGNPWGITQNGIFIWITDITDDEVYKYDMEGNYMGNSWDTTEGTNAHPRGITQNDTFFWILHTTIYGVYLYEGPDTKAPNVIIVSPTNSSYTTTTIEFNLTVTDSSGVDACLYSLDVTANITMSNDTASNFYASNTTMAQGSHTVYFYCNDTLNNLNNSESVVFFIDSVSPSVTSLTETPTDPATYSSGGVYEFNATITDISGIDTVLLEFDGINYTASNLTADIYNVTFKDLSVGAYNYRWYANDTLNNINNSETSSYTINKASSQTSLTFDKESPQNYGTAITPTCSVLSGVGTAVLKMDGNVVTSGAAMTLGVDTYTFNCSLDTTQNYTASSNSSDFIISKATPAGSLAGTSPITYGTAGDVEGTESNAGDSDVAYKLYRDNIEVSNPDTTILEVETYGYIYNTTGGENYSAVASLDTFSLIVAVNVSKCVTLSQANIKYTQTANIINNTLISNCISITAENITLDCAGYYISSDDAYSGVYSNQYNTTIKNCNISMRSGIGGNGIELVSANNSYIFNNTLSEQYTGLRLISTKNTKIKNNTANSDYYGIYLSSSSNNNLTNILTGSISGVGLLFSSSSNNNLKNIVASSIGGVGIFLSSSSNNTLTNITANSNINGIQLSSSSNNTLTNITANSNSQYGIHLDESSNNNILIDITANSNLYGLFLRSSSNNNILIDITANSNIRGIILDSSSSNALTNITANSNGDYGIYLSSSSINTLINITANGNDVAGIHLSSSSSNNFTNIIVNSNSLHGIWLLASSNNIIQNSITNLNEGYGIYFHTSSNNVLTNINSSSNLNGIRLWSSSNNNNFTNIVANSNKYYGIFFHSYSNSNIIKNSITNSNRNYGIHLQASSNNILTNITSNSNRWVGIHLSEYSRYNTFTNITTNSNGGTILIAPRGGILLEARSDYNTFTNLVSNSNEDFGFGIKYSFGNNITDANLSSNARDVIVDGGLTINNIFLNASYLEDRAYSGAQLTRKWYFESQVNDSTGNFMQNANVSIYNVSSFIVNSELTDATGNIARKELIEYINIGGTKTYHTPHIINVSKDLYATNSTIYNLTEKQNNYHYVSLTYTLIIDIEHPEPIAYSYNESLPLNYTITNGTTIDTCWYNIYNSTNDLIIGNTTLSTCQNTIFNISQGDGTYDLTLYSNITTGKMSSSNVIFWIFIIFPAINLNSPTDNSWLDYKDNIYFNFTATDSDGLGACELWGNWTGTWHKNHTWVSPINATMNYTTVNITDGDGAYLWNVWCNDTSGNGGFSPTNYTSMIDMTYPQLIYNSPTGTIYDTLSTTLIFDVNDSNVLSCYYNLTYTDGTSYRGNANIPQCNSTITDYTTINYNLNVDEWREWFIWLTLKDKAGNINITNASFTTARTESPPGSIAGEKEFEPEPIIYKTFCGDGVCQLEGNDYDIKENYWNCNMDCPGFDFDAFIYSFTKYCWDKDLSTVCFWTQQLFSTIPIGEPAELAVCGDGICQLTEHPWNCQEDCPPINVDTLIKNCIDKDPATYCFFSSNIAWIILFIGFAGLMILQFTVKLKVSEGRKRVSPYQYVKLKYKKRRRWKR